MISAVASVEATRSICSYKSSITGDEPYSRPYDFSPAMPSVDALLRLCRRIAAGGDGGRVQID